MATIYLNNKAQIKVDYDQLDRIASKACLPAGKIVLVLNDGPLPGKNQGVCVPKALIKFSRSYVPICEGRNRESWDVCVAVSGKYCLLANEYPAYFAYLIGHELGHARICLSDLALHIHYCLIQDHIKIASNYQITQWCELPHEQRFDQYGIYIALQLFPRHQFNEEIEGLLEKAKCNDRVRLQLMLSLPPSNNLDGLRDEIVRFSSPYKYGLIQSWQKDYQANGEASLVSLIRDYDALFR